MTTWNMGSLLELADGFTKSRILLTAAELNLFSLLTSPKTLDEVIAALNSDRRGTAILLDALTAMELLTKQDATYACPDDVAALLAADAPESVLPMVLHCASLWQRWGALTDIVRSGEAAAVPSGIFTDEDLTAFILAMHVVGRHMAEPFAKAVRADDSRALLDVGGATGTYAEAFLRQYPNMRATIFDQAPVIQLAHKRLKGSNVRDRIALVPGNFYTDPLPDGHDLALLSAIIHQNSHEQNIALYKKCFDALVSGGRILVRDHVLSPDRIHPADGALFAVNMLAATEKGNCYTYEEIADGLRTAGFEKITLVQEDKGMDGVVEAFKP